MHKITLFSKVEGKLGEGWGRVMMLKQLMLICVEHKPCHFFMHEYTCKKIYNVYPSKHMIGQESFIKPKG